MNSFKLDLGIGKKSICGNCGFNGRPIKENKGSVLIAIILLLFFIFPGIIYILWSLSGRKFICPLCKQPTMIPINSPRGQVLAQEQTKK